MRKSDTVIVRPVRQARHLVASLLAGVLLAGCATGDGEAPPAASVAATVDPGHPDTGHPDFGGMLHSDHVLTAARVLNPQLRIETVGDADGKAKWIRLASASPWRPVVTAAVVTDDVGTRSVFFLKAGADGRLCVVPWPTVPTCDGEVPWTGDRVFPASGSGSGAEGGPDAADEACPSAAPHAATTTSSCLAPGGSASWSRQLR